ncbi:phosphatase PAP2 family protein [Gordonibacter sp. 28C]|uniref:phosphatase PAP2 family protein n=1 Tax=Gordonibacter sp. 28C TaxID=2078569 RepID=UPI000DF83858|nr:phosphatase PAP2 family protein [Gordonibacter sp. 28C]RDB62310.1 phosphatase PAP2 family protein [Gordonibacter sp. 28C]
METTLTAAWLNVAFAAFDTTILGALHALAEYGGFAFTPLFEAVSFAGEKGACFFALAIVLMAFKRTRRAGAVMFVAVCLGALATNIVLKDLVARPRPFESSALYLDWWRFVGAVPEDGFSFPSGHMTAASAAMVALMLAYRNWKTVLGGSLVMLVMGAARCYLVAHYPSDVLAGFLVGALAAVVAWLLVTKTLDLIEARRTERGRHGPASLRRGSTRR